MRAATPRRRASAKRVWGVTDDGNFEESGATGALDPVVEASRPADAARRRAAPRARAPGDVRRRARSAPKPFRDEKILASWNGLMIGALADGRGGARDPALVAAAERALRFVERALVVPEAARGGARVLRLAKDGVVKGQGSSTTTPSSPTPRSTSTRRPAMPRWVALARSLGESHPRALPRPGGRRLLLHAGRRRDASSSAPRTRSTTPSRAARRWRAACSCASGRSSTRKYAEPPARAVEALASRRPRNPFGMSSAGRLVDRLVRGSVDVVLVGPRDSEATRRSPAKCYRALRARPGRRLARSGGPGDARGRCAVLAEGKPAQREPGRLRLPGPHVLAAHRKRCRARGGASSERGPAPTGERAASAQAASGGPSGRLTLRRGAGGGPRTSRRTGPRARRGPRPATTTSAGAHLLDRLGRPAVRRAARPRARRGGADQLRPREPPGLARREARQHGDDAPHAVGDAPRHRDALDDRIEELARRADAGRARRRTPRRAAPSAAASRARCRRAAARARGSSRRSRPSCAKKRRAPPSRRLLVVEERRELGQEDRHRARLPEEPHRAVRRAAAEQAEDLLEDARAAPPSRGLPASTTIAS